MNFQGYESEDDSAIEKQIKIDLLRTMPTHTDFSELDKGKVNVRFSFLFCKDFLLLFYE